MNTHRIHVDVGHHHPVVRRHSPGRWSWACSCGGASARCDRATLSWRLAVLGALNHSATIAA